MLRKAVDQQPEEAGHRLVLAGFFWKTGQREKAAAVLVDLAGLEPDKEKHTIAAAQFYFKQKDVGRAGQMLRDGIAANPDSFMLREALADYFVGIKAPDKGHGNAGGEPFPVQRSGSIRAS